MRSFNANFTTEKNSKSGITPILLVKFNFATPVYLSDYTVTPSGGTEHKGLIKAWSFIDSDVGGYSGSAIFGGFEVGDMDLTIINSINSGATPFSNNFTESDPPENVTVNIYQWFAGLLYSEKEEIFRGTIFGQPEYNLYECKLTIRGIFQKYNKIIGEDLVVNQATYSGADPDDIGKMLPIVYGSCKNVPFLAVNAGGRTNLASDIDDSVTTVSVSDSSVLTSSGVIQIDSEQISYSGKSGNDLTGCTRGYNSTSSVSHSLGATVAQIQTEYCYLIGHVVKAINAVYVDKVRQTTEYTAYTGQSGDEHASYPGKACIKFTVLPSLQKQVNVSLDDSLTVSDDIDLSATGSLNCVSTDSDVGTSFHYDGGSDSHTWSISTSSSYFTPGYSASKSHDGMVERWDIGVSVKSYGTAGTFELKVTCMSTGSTVTVLKIESGVITVGPFLPFTKADSGHDSPTYSAQLYGTSNSSFNGDLTVSLSNIEITLCVYDLTSSKSGSAYRDGSISLSGNSVVDTVIGSQVTADLDGYKDDASGTYTGTANALIQRPDHVFKHAWCVLLGAASGDIDSTSFTAAGTFFNTNSYAFAHVLREPIEAAEWLKRLAFQCRSRVFVSPDGKFKLVVGQLSQSSGHAIPKAEIQWESVSIKRSRSEDIVNYLNIFYDLDFSADKSADRIAENCRGVEILSDSTSISRYGQRTLGHDRDLLVFDAVSNATMANHVGTFYLDFLKAVRKVIEFGVFLDNMEIEPADIIDITHDLDSMVGYVIEVLKINRVIGSGKDKRMDCLKITSIQN